MNGWIVAVAVAVAVVAVAAAEQVEATLADDESAFDGAEVAEILPA
jgi:hypothetical protein